MPIYEYSCECGKRFEEFRSIDSRHDTVCSCGRKAQLLISKVADANPFRDCIPLTLIDGEGNVIGRRNDHHKTPMFNEFYGAEVQQRAAYGQEMAHKELVQERSML